MTLLEDLAKQARSMPGDVPEERWAHLIEQKVIDAGDPPFSPWWCGTIDKPGLLRQFWRSGKTGLAVGKANRAGGTTHIQGMCAVPEMLFRERRPYGDSELIWPNASATIDLANGALRTFAATCRALGFTEVRGRSKDLAKRLEPGTIFVSEGNRSSPGTVEALDVSGNRVEFRSQPANDAGLSSFTGIGFTADEIELKGWGTPEETRRTLGLGQSRLKNQAGAHEYLISRLFSEDGVLYKICQRGSNEGLMVALLGEEGARDDERARLFLKGHLEALARVGDRTARLYSEDERLVEESNPESFIIPGWSGLPVGDNLAPGPEAAIMACWKLACTGIDCDEGEDPLDALFRVYGGRPTGLEGSKYFGARHLREARLRRIS